MKKMNLSKSILLCFFAVCIAFFALPLFAETTLQVKCIDSSGAPVSNVKVSVVTLKTQKAKEKKSDAQGGAEFTKLEDGLYRVFGRKEGMVPAFFEPALLKGTPETVTLKFAAGAEKKFYFEDEAEAKKAKDLLDQGLEAYKQSKFPDAEKLLNEALAVNPSLAEAYYYIAVSRLQQGKYDEANEALDKTSALASALMTLPSGSGSGPNPYERILQGAQDVKKKMPAIRAEDALRQKNFDEAVKQFSELIKTNPNTPEFHANLATALFYLGKYDEATAAIDKAIQLKPGQFDNMKKTIAAKKESAELDKAQALMDEGNKLLKDGDAAGALKKFEQTKTMVAEERQSPVWAQIGRAQAKLNQPEAVASFKKAIALSPADKVSDYRNTLAMYYIDLKKFDDAVDVLADPKVAGPDSPEKVLFGVVKQSKDKQPKLAEAALERIIKLNPSNFDAVFDLGQLYYSDGKENDRRTKELLTLYTEKGQDAQKLEGAKGMLVIINRRTK
jgi:tetratricopeptide (TPR) repeat protein